LLEQGLCDIKQRSIEQFPGFPLYFGSEIQGLFKDFQKPEVEFSRTNSRRKFTAWTVLQQYVISISVIMVQF